MATKTKSSDGGREAAKRKSTAFVYLASEIDSSYVTGEILTLLGGDTTAA